MKTTIFIGAVSMLSCIFQSFGILSPTYAPLPAPATLTANSICESDCGTKCETRIWTLTAGSVPGATYYEWSWTFKRLDKGTPYPCANQCPITFTTTSNVATDIYLPEGEITLSVKAKNGTESSEWKTRTFKYRNPNKICP